MKLLILLFALVGTCFAFRHSHHHKLYSKFDCQAGQSCPPSPDLKGFTALSVPTVQTDVQIKSLCNFGWSYIIQRIIVKGGAPDDTYTLDQVTEVGVQTIKTWTYYRFTVTLVNTKNWRITIAYIISFNTETDEISVGLTESCDWVASKDPIAPAIVTQTGTPNPINGGSYASGSRSDRSFISHINFPQAFSEVPSVGLNLVGFDNQIGQWNFEIFPQNITTTGFDINVTLHTPVNNLYSFQPSYIATISKYSGIYFVQHSISTDDADVLAISRTAGNRTITRELTDIDLTGKKSMVFLRGMGFAGGHPALSVEISDNSLVYKTWDNALFLRAASTIVYWDASKRDVFTLDVGTTPDQLYPGFGGRTITVPFNSTGGLQSPQMWAGLWRLHFNGNYNDRLQHHLDPAYTYINITTWYDSHVHDIQDHVFMACQDGNAACLSN